MNCNFSDLLETQGLTLDGENSVFLFSTGTPTENAAEFRAVYAAAKLMTPNGNPLSDLNRYTIVISPGLYDFTPPFDDYTQYIDIVTLTGYNDVLFNSIPIPSLYSKKANRPVNTGESFIYGTNFIEILSTLSQLGVDLYGVNLFGVDFSMADLSALKLNGANFGMCTFSYTTMASLQVAEASFQDATGLDPDINIALVDVDKHPTGYPESWWIYWTDGLRYSYNPSTGLFSLT